MSRRRYEPRHERREPHWILFDLFGFGPSIRRWLGIEPRHRYESERRGEPSRRTEYQRRGESEQGRGYYAAADQGGQPNTIAERRAAEYRRRMAEQGRQAAPPGYQQQGYQQPQYQQPHQQPRAGTHHTTHQGGGSYAASRPRKFHDTRPTEGGGVHSHIEQQAHGVQTFQPLPRPTGQPPYHMALESVLPPQQVRAIEASGRMLLHIVGDTGGVKSPESQQIVAMAMEAQFNYPDVTVRPAFFYHLGDIAYFYGEPKEYYPQFYDPYIHYPAPIFAIPGNHDGDMTDGSPPSLTAFVDNFCATTPHVTKEAGETSRDTMTQPNVFWTLEAPFVTIIGLYSNVPEGGRLQPDQLAWFVNELRTAPTDKALLVAVHHPAYSADMHHSGSSHIVQALDESYQQSGRLPDAVFMGHVHNYQRFTRELAGRHIPYIVAGGGGYWHLHYMARTPDGNKMPIPYKMPDADVTLENYCDDRHGFMRLMVTPTQISGEYFGCPRPQESWRGEADRIDGFVLDWRRHKLIKGTELR